jgi:hypothetical protein
MTDRLPHVREPSSGEPDVCVHCREEWVDLLTLYETDECSVRLRAEVERLRAHRESCAANLLKGYETGKADERAAVVAWMRDLGDQVPVARDQWIADCIERGEHRREENE